MKKIFKLVSIILAVTILLLGIAAIAIPLLIPKEAIKDFATQKISEAINRTVSIEGVSFNIFEGIKLEGITVSNHKNFSDQAFISAKSFNLKYALWPLFTGKVLIHEIALVKPEILIEKDSRGRSSLDDLVKAKAERPASPAQLGGQKGKEKKKIDLIVSNISITDGRFIYNDQLTGKNEIKNIDLKVSGITFALIKPIDINASATANYQNKDIPLSIQTKIKVDPNLDSISIPTLLVNIASEGFSCPIEVENLAAGPNISFNLFSKNLSLDTLLGLFATSSKTIQTKPSPGQLTKSIKNSTKSIPDSLTIKGSINIKNASLKKIKLDKFSGDLSLSGKKIWLKLKEVSGYEGSLTADARINLEKLTYELKPINLKGFNAAPFISDSIDSFLPKLINMKNKTEGTLDLFLSLSGQGVEMPDAFNNLKADGVVVLTKGRLKKIESLNSIADKYNLSTLKHDIHVKGLRIEGILIKKILDIKHFDLKGTDLEVGFKGGLNFNNMEYQKGNLLTLKLSPTAAKGLPKEFSVFKDERDYVNVDFELLGSLYKPIPSPRLDKPIEATIGKLKLKIDAQKIILESKVKNTASAEAEELKKKAAEKIKEILKF